MRNLRHYAAGLAVGLLSIVGGCASQPDAVPSSAMMMTSGNGAASFRPTEFGRVYVTDQTDNKILYQADVDRGELVQLDARQDKISVDGRTVSDRSLEDAHDYRIFFEPLSKERLSRYRVTEETTTTTMRERP
jgi:hypothetical protein